MKSFILFEYWEPFLKNLEFFFKMHNEQEYREGKGEKNKSK